MKIPLKSLLSISTLAISANLSSAKNPALWRVFSYFFPGLPKPTNSFIFLLINYNIYCAIIYDMNRFLKRFLQGLLLGFALITAIGGGTMAILIGVYDELINAVSDFRKDPKKSLSLLGPMALGGIVSMGALFYPIKLALEHFPFLSISFFAGLTLGGLRIFTGTIKGNVTWKNLLLTLAGFLFVFGLGTFTWFTTLPAKTSVG